MSIKLIADSTDKLSDLKQISKDFEKFITQIPGIKNVTNSSPDNPGEIVFRIDRERSASMGITPLQIFGEISATSRGVNAGTITLGDQDIDIVVKSDTHEDTLQIDKIQNLTIQTKNGPVLLGSLLTYTV